jgi:hypothetical protein
MSKVLLKLKRFDKLYPIVFRKNHYLIRNTYRKSNLKHYTIYSTKNSFKSISTFNYMYELVELIDILIKTDPNK